MALQEAMTCLSFEAGSDLTGHQFKFVTMAADGQVDLTTSAGSFPLGVVQQVAAVAGREVTVCVAGRVKIKAGGTIAAGATVSVNASGLAVTSATAGHAFIGRALTGAASGELVEVLLGYNGVASA